MLSTIRKKVKIIINDTNVNVKTSRGSNNKQEIKTFTHLPPEIIIYITKYCDYKTIRNLFFILPIFRGWSLVFKDRYKKIYKESLKWNYYGGKNYRKIFKGMVHIEKYNTINVKSTLEEIIWYTSNPAIKYKAFFSHESLKHQDYLSKIDNIEIIGYLFSRIYPHTIFYQIPSHTWCNLFTWSKFKDNYEDMLSKLYKVGLFILIDKQKDTQKIKLFENFINLPEYMNLSVKFHKKILFHAARYSSKILGYLLSHPTYELTKDLIHELIFFSIEYENSNSAQYCISWIKDRNIDISISDGKLMMMSFNHSLNSIAKQLIPKNVRNYDVMLKIIQSNQHCFRGETLTENIEYLNNVLDILDKY